MRTVLIDADIPIYQACAQAEHERDWGGGLWTLHSHEADVTTYFDDFIAEIEEALGADQVILAVSDGHNFRKDVLPTYKENRVKKRPPMLRGWLTEYALDEYNCYQRPGLEGDDILGILSTHPKIIEGEKIIVSIDKDLRTIPGFILNWNHARHNVNAGIFDSLEDSIYEVKEDQADYFHLLQTLAGDTTDGYSGCPGVGMQTADKILSDDPHIVVPKKHVITRGKRKGQEEVRYEPYYEEQFTPWQTVVSYFEKAGLGEEEALTQARVARICRASDYDFKKKEVKLWVPLKT